MTTLAEAFDRLFEHEVIDKTTVDRVYKFQTGFLNRNSETLAFFGSNLIGVHVVSWRTTDSTRFFRDVLRMDYVTVEKALKQVDSIVQSRKVSSNPVNLTIMYLIHRFLTSSKLTQKDKDRGIYDLALLFFYRSLVIRQSEWFHHPADPKVAQAAYALLSNQFLIKQLGSWKALCEYRAKELIKDPKKGGLHLDDLRQFTDDDRIVYAINNAENSIKSIYKLYNRTFYEAYHSGARIGTSSSTIVDMEGVEKIRERTRHTDVAVNTIRQLIHDQAGFVKLEYIDVILNINTNTSQRAMVSVLTWLSVNSNNPKWHKLIDEYITTIVVHSYHLLAEMDMRGTRDYSKLLTTLKNLYLSTRSTDPDLKRIRILGDQLVTAANGKTNNSLLMATRTATILYITLRALTSPG